MGGLGIRMGGGASWLMEEAVGLRGVGGCVACEEGVTEPIIPDRGRLTNKLKLECPTKCPALALMYC